MNDTQTATLPDWWQKTVQSGAIVQSPAPPQPAANMPAGPRDLANGGVELPGDASGPGAATNDPAVGARWKQEWAADHPGGTPPAQQAPALPKWWQDMVSGGGIVAAPEASLAQVAAQTSGGSSGHDLAQQTGAGMLEGGAGIINTLADPFGNLIGRPLATGLSYAHDALAPLWGGKSFTPEERADLLGDQVPQLGTQIADTAAKAATGKPLADVQPPANSTESAIRTGISSGIQGLAMGPRAVLPTMAGAFGGQAAGEMASPYWQPAAELGGQIAGGGIGGGIQEGAASIYNKGTAAVGRAGVGPKQTIGGQRVTGSQADTVGQQLNQPGLLPKLQAQEANAARIAEIDQHLADPALAPADKAALMDERAGLVPQTQGLGIGAKPTLAQSAITPGAAELPSESLAGINRLEQNARRDAPATFIARDTEQNTNRLGTIGGQAQGGNADSVGQMFTKQLDALESGQKAAVGGAATQRQAAGGAALGGLQTTPEYGAQMHEALSAEQATAKEHANRLYAAVDPDRNMAANVAPAKAAAAQVLTSTNPVQGIDTGAQLHPGVARMAQAMSQMPDVVPFEALRQIRTQVGEVTRDIGGNPQLGRESVPMRQAMTLKSAIDQSIQEAVDRATQGSMESPLAKRMLTEMEGMNGATASQTGAVAGNEGSIQNGSVAYNRPTGPTVSRQGGSGSTQGITAPAGNGGAGRPAVEERITPEQATAYQGANANYREYKSTFAQGPVGQALGTDRFGARKTPDISVPRKFFTAGDTNPDAVAAYVKATGGKEPALALARDYLVHELRHDGVVDANTGAMDVGKFGKWAQRRGPAIDALGGDLKAKLGNAKTAQEFYDKTVAEHEAKIKEFQKGVAKSFIGADPEQAVSQALAAHNPDKFRSLALAVRGDKDATEGLKRAVVDWVGKRMSGATAATEQENFLKADTLQKWIMGNQKALKSLFGGQQLQTWQMIAADLRRGSQRPVAQSGSRTATEAAAKPGLMGGHGHSLFSFMVGEGLGHAVEHFIKIPLAGEAGGAIGIMLNSMRQHGIDSQTALLREALLHPDIARVLMERVAGKSPGPVLLRRLAARLQSSLLANQMALRQPESEQ